VLSVGEIIRLDLARAIMKKPSWVVISSVFYQVPTALQEKVLSALKDKGIGVLVWSAGIGTQSSSFDEAISFSRNKIEGGSL
jgi:ABC-type lipopolysaccharide export system ATPase subunit